MMSGGQPEYRGNAAQSEAVVTGICASYTASVAARNTPGDFPDRDADHRPSDVAHITPPRSGICYLGVAARNTLQDFPDRDTDHLCSNEHRLHRIRSG